MAVISKKEADAYDRMLDAAADLAELITSAKIDIDEETLEELSIFLARHGPRVRTILKGATHTWP
jgi:uncharacterized protein